MFALLTIKNKIPCMHNIMQYAVQACVMYISSFSLLELNCNCDFLYSVDRAS
jgi:hypothetical protein